MITNPSNYRLPSGLWDAIQSAYNSGFKGASKDLCDIVVTRGTDSSGVRGGSHFNGNAIDLGVYGDDGNINKAVLYYFAKHLSARNPNFNVALSLHNIHIHVDNDGQNGSGLNNEKYSGGLYTFPSFDDSASREYYDVPADSVMPVKSYWWLWLLGLLFLIMAVLGGGK